MTVESRTSANAITGPRGVVAAVVGTRHKSAANFDCQALKQGQGQVQVQVQVLLCRFIYQLYIYTADTVVGMEVRWAYGRGICSRWNG